MPGFVLQDVWSDPQGCLAFFPKGNVACGGITWEDAGDEPATAQSFGDSATLVDTQAYWEYLFGSICGDDWFTNIAATGYADVVSDAPWTASPTKAPTSRSSVSFSAVWATLIVWVSSVVIVLVD